MKVINCKRIATIVLLTLVLGLVEILVARTVDLDGWARGCIAGLIGAFYVRVLWGSR